jgi:putative transcriptional regulator
MYSMSTTIDGLMERHAMGALPAPLDVMARAHLEIKSDNRSYVNDLEVLAGEHLTDLKPIEISDRENALDRVFNASAPIERSVSAAHKRDAEPWMPAAIRDFLGRGDVPWRTRMPGFKQYNLGKVDGCEVEMLWIKAGRAMPNHTHEGSELTLVLDGAFHDDTGKYGRGDISIADQNVNHRPVADKSGPCVCFAVTTDSLRLTGRLHERLRDILRG